MKTRTAFLCLAFALPMLLAASAPGQEHMWSQSFGGSFNQVLEAVALHDDFVVLAGSYSGAMDIDGSMLTSQGEYDIFLVCLEHTGGICWSRSFGDYSNDKLRDMVVTSDGTILLAGDFFGGIDFGGDPLVSAGDKDAFVAAFNIYGDHQWSNNYGDSFYDSARALITDGSGGLFLAGQFNGSIDLGGGPFTALVGQDLFLVNLNSAGNHIWSAQFGGYGDCWIHDLAPTFAGYALAGAFDGTIDLGSGNYGTTDQLDGFLATFALDGEPLWSHAFGGSGDQRAKALDSNTEATVVLAGEFENALEGGGLSLSSMGGTDIFLAQYDSDGFPVWSQSFGDHNDQQAEALEVNEWGNIALTGCVEGDIDFGGGLLNSAGSGDICFAGFRHDGLHLWSALYGDGYDQWGTALAADPWGDWILGCIFSGSVDFGGGAFFSDGYDAALARFGTTVAVPSKSAACVTLNCYPNPFNPRTTIRYELSEKTRVTLRIFDLTGRLVAVLVESELQPAGTHTSTWVGCDSQGCAMPSGTYFSRLETGGYAETKRMTLIR